MRRKDNSFLENTFDVAVAIIASAISVVMLAVTTVARLRFPARTGPGAHLGAQRHQLPSPPRSVPGGR